MAPCGAPPLETWHEAWREKERGKKKRESPQPQAPPPGPSISIEPEKGLKSPPRHEPYGDERDRGEGLVDERL